MQITLQQALDNIFIGSRKALLTADEHVIMQKSKDMLQKLLDDLAKEEENIVDKK
jgi:hypothetical protein